MKKAVLISLVMVLAIGLVVLGCGQAAPSTTQPPAQTTANAPSSQPPTTPAATQVTKLTFANWLPPMNPCSKVYDQWAKDFEAKTGGRYTVEVVHGGALAAIPEAYDKVANGIVDISMFVAQDVQKPFPVTNMSALPWSHLPGQVYTEAWFKNVFSKGYLDKEFSNLKIVMQYWGPGEDLLTMDAINSVADLQGKKIMGGGGVKPEIYKQLGAVWVMGGPPDAYEMLQKNMVRGIAISGLGLQEFHWADYIKYIIEPMRMTGVMHTVAMNLDVYKKMPADIKAIFDGMNADGKYSIKASGDFEAAYAATVADWLKSGAGTSIKWSPDEVAKLNAVVAPISDEQIKTLEGQGVPAKEIINNFYSGLKALGVDNPAVGYTPK
jgi:TRAP-type C4-dicarboxylate transport system substrate-binding protein